MNTFIEVLVVSLFQYYEIGIMHIHTTIGPKAYLFYLLARENSVGTIAYSLLLFLFSYCEHFYTHILLLYDLDHG